MAAAETAFGGVVALREHFRCVPEIIQSPDRVTAAADELPGAIFWSGLGRERLALCEHGHQPPKMVAQQHAGRRLDVCIGVCRSMIR
jgi:hypothetical protein